MIAFIFGSLRFLTCHILLNGLKNLLLLPAVTSFLGVKTAWTSSFLLLTLRALEAARIYDDVSPSEATLLRSSESPGCLLKYRCLEIRLCGVGSWKSAFKTSSAVANEREPLTPHPSTFFFKLEKKNSLKVTRDVLP